MNIKNLLLLYVFIQVIGCTNTSQNNESTKDRLVVVEKKIKQEPEIDHTDPKIVSKYILTKTVSITMQDKYKQTVSCGSGFILDTGLVVTNKHVIENATYGFIDLKGNKHKIEGYVAIDKTNDLVILKVPSVIEQGIMQNSGELATGEKVYVAGNPQGLSETVSTGIISNPKRVFENKELIQISAPISPGSSGGPVVNERGELIGVAVGAITEGQNLNFAVPLKYIILLTKNVSQMKNLDIKTT